MKRDAAIGVASAVGLVLGVILSAGEAHGWQRDFESFHRYGEVPPTSSLGA